MIDEIQTALNTRLASGFTGDIAWEGVPFYPVTGKPYVTASIAGRAAEDAGVGPNVPRFWRGVFQLVVAYPIGEGTTHANKMATDLLNLFPRGLGLPAGASYVIIESGTAASTYSTSDYINIPVSLMWICEER